jgi:fibronectin type 3 domain-containing protein
LADSSTPIGLTATARSDHRVDLTWSWPADPTYPDELDVLRDGVFIGSADPASSTSFEDDDVGPPGSTHSYQLVTVTDGMGSTPTPASVATLRADLPNAPTNVDVTIAPVTNIATVTWTRGALDSDVTYTVTAQQDAGSPIISRTTRSAGSLTIDGLASYTSYLFNVSAVEDVGDPPGDPGGTTPGTPEPVRRTFDVLSPQFNSPTLQATPAGLGTITATWPAASDSGSGVASYLVCVDTIMCESVPYQAFLSSQTATPGAPNVPNDGGSHTVTVVAVDGAGNQSSPLTKAVVMPVPGTPLISLQGAQGGDGCHPLVANVTSADAGTTGLVYHLFVNGVASDSLIGQQITGTPYGQVTLTAQATYGGDSSAVSSPLTPRIYDPDGPASAPTVHGQADLNSSSEALSWDPVTAATGAPVDGYQVTSPTAPGITGTGVFVPQSSAPGIVLKGLAPLDTYTVNVVTVDHCGRPSPPPDKPFPFRVSDAKGPSAPVLNPPTADGHNVFLSWAPSIDDVAVDNYWIFRGNTRIGTTPGTTFEDSNLDDAQSYNYYVVAYDTAGNQGLRSNVVTGTTRDLTPPSRPGTVTATPSGGNVTLKWVPASDNVKVAGYRVSRSPSASVQASVPMSGTIIATVTGTTYVDNKVPAGQYTWGVQAVDAAGNVSGVSTASATSNGSPKATAASALKVVRSKGVMAVKVGGKSGQRVVLSFKLMQPFTRAVLHLHVLAGKAKVRISLPSGSGRTTPGKRLGERISKKGILKIPLGTQKSGTLRLVVTAQGGLVTIAGKGGAKSPTIMNVS